MGGDDDAHWLRDDPNAMTKTDLEEYSGDPLTPLENRKMRRLLEQDDRAHWFWSSSRIWLTTLATAITAAIVIANGGIDFIKKLLLFK